MALCLLLVLFLVSAVSAEEITVTGEDGRTLEHYLCTGVLTSNTELILSPGEHTTTGNGTCIVRGLNNITIRGVENELVRITCIGNQRIFAFLNIINLRIEGFELSRCGGFIPESLADYVNISSTVRFGPYQRAAFILSMISNLTIKRLSFSQSIGYGIVGVNLDHSIDLERFRIIDTRYEEIDAGCDSNVRSITDYRCTGAGLLLVFLENNLNFSTTIPSNPQSETSVSIKDSLFSANVFDVPVSLQESFRNNIRSNLPHNNPFYILGGTGITIYVNQNNPLKISCFDCSFFDNDNKNGPGSLTLFTMGRIHQVSVNVNKSVFNINRGGLGAAISAFVIDPKSSNGSNTFLTVHDTSITSNQATEGSACYVLINSETDDSTSILLSKMRLTSNIAERGYTLYMENIRRPEIGFQNTKVVLKDVTVVNSFSTLGILVSFFQSQNAACYFKDINNVIIMGNSQWYNNRHGAITLTQGNLFFQDNATFSGNSDSERGGAINLIEGFIFIHEKSNIRFTNNTAPRGSAVFATRSSSSETDFCVIQVISTQNITNSADIKRLGIQITFNYIDTEEWYANERLNYGRSIFASPIYECNFIHLNTEIDNYNFFNGLLTFTDTYSQGYNQEVSSSPISIEICSNEQLRAIPGQTISLEVRPLDRVNNTLEAEINLEIEDSSNNFKLGSDTIRQFATGRNCSPIAVQLFPRDSNPNSASSNVTISLHSPNSPTQARAIVSVENCPPGFLYTGQSIGLDQFFSCSCDQGLLDTLPGFRCEDGRYLIAQPGQQWIARTRNIFNNPILGWADGCPPGYCDPEVENVDLATDEAICTEHREGVLCGRCSPGFSTVFGSSECMQCSNWYFFTLLLYLIAGLAIVLILFALDLTVTRGTINGLIFYMNIVVFNTRIFLRDKPSFPSVFVSLLNLDLGFPLCFYNGMSETVKFVLQFAFPLYLYILCGVIVFSSRWSKRISKLTSSKGIAVLNTLFYLSFVKLVRASIYCLLALPVRENDRFGHNIRYVWYFDGNLPYFASTHVLPGVLAFIFLIPALFSYIIPLLFIKQFFKVSCCSARYKPMFDSIAAPYKDKYLYWFGLRLVLSLVINGLSYLPTDSISLTLQIFLLLALAMFESFVKPYKNKLISILDLTFLLNYISMSLWALYLKTASGGKSRELTIVVYVFVSLACLKFCGILVYHVLDTLYKNSARLRACIEATKQKFESPLANEESQEMEDSDDFCTNSKAKVTYSVVGVRSKRGQTFLNSVRQSFSQLREPLMDNIELKESRE